MNVRNFSCFHLAIGGIFVCFFSAPLPAQSKSTVVEEIVARVNNEIITLSDYQKAQEELSKEVQQECQTCTPDKIQAEIKDQQKDLLRGLIDNALLVERAKDMS